MSEISLIHAKRLSEKKDNLISKKRGNINHFTNSTAERILFLQRTAGNQAVSRLMKSGALQVKLRIGQPGDRYEQEADRVADVVMRMPEPEVQRQPKKEEELIRIKPLVKQITPLIQRQVTEEEGKEEEPLSDVTQMSITEGWAQRLGDGELIEQIRHVREQLLTSEPGTPEYEAVRGNLRILETEISQRQRSFGELASPSMPTATVILVGSPTDETHGYDISPYNFTKSAVKVVPKIQAVLSGTHVAILYFSPGYKLRGANVHQKALNDLKATGATVIEVTTAKDVISFLNTGLVSSEESIPTRAVKVSRFIYFGHGGAGEMLLNWGWGREYHSIKKEDIINIKTEAFNPIGKSYLFTCHIAERKGSFMSVWASHLGQTSFGPQGSAAFNFWYKSYHLKRAINKQLPKWFLGMPYMNRIKIIDPEQESAQSR
ncbi:MAG: hypothetical protein BA867_04990 [Desulfobacterales bacterium S5133MH16]|nr:MAG: hypothetical protein BA867_04990 [Desulfobacterales bacterium S5133MH16]